jgi:hypothetical protein
MPNQEQVMNRISWWLVDTVSGILEPDERNTVLRNFAECGVTRGHPLGQLLGLIMRREAILWKDWHPWLAFIWVGGLVGWRLSRFSFSLSRLLSLYLLTYSRFGVRYDDGLTVSQDLVMFACQSLALILYSWSAGFVLGSLSRRTIWMSGALFYLSGLLPGNAMPMTLLPAFRWLPLLPHTVLFLLPSIWGLRRGLRVNVLGLRRTILLAATISAITALATWTGGWRQAALETWSKGVLPQKVPWQARLASLAVLCSPVACTLVAAISRRLSSTHISD